jgi:ABC-type multidrug transport system fused ATPase/permease subunit
MLVSYPFSKDASLAENLIHRNNPADQYNVHIVNALLAGQAHLDIEPSEELLALENPYDPVNLIGVPHLFDFAFYKGKYYSYFGIVQVLTLALPYKVITGEYIPTRLASFIFSALAGVFLMLLWRRLVIKYMKNMKLGMYLLGQLSVGMCSMLVFLTVRPLFFYGVAGASGLFFVALGLWLIMGSTFESKIKRTSLLFGCLCMALAVGCRPTYFLASFLVPILLFDGIKALWAERQQNKPELIRVLLCACIPYIVVASGLMFYNYIRFDSVFEFGSNYMLTRVNFQNTTLLHPLSSIARVITLLHIYIIPEFNMSASFPFVHLGEMQTEAAFRGDFFRRDVLGLLGVPLMWGLFGIGFFIRNATAEGVQTLRNLIIGMIAIGFIHMVFLSSTAGVHLRYTVDFFWLFTFSALICIYFMYNAIEKNFQPENCINQKIKIALPKIARRVVYMLLISSSILIFLVSLRSGRDLLFTRNPDIFYQLQSFLGFVNF